MASATKGDGCVESAYPPVIQAFRYAPAGTYATSVNAGSRTGRHVVYVIWQASHLDQSYYFCNDVIFQ